MPSKSQIKLVKSLHLKKNRKANGLFVAEGAINVSDFLNSDLIIDKLYATEKWTTANRELALTYNAEKVSHKEMEMMTLLKNPSDVLAVFKLPDLKMITKNDIDDYVLMLDNIKDPGNLGTIIRTADWFGISTVICSSETVDVFNPKVVQATMGSLARVNVFYTEPVKFLKRIKNIDVYGAFLNGTPVNKIEKKGNGIIIIGSEAHGISKEVEEFVNKRITIPSFRKNSKKAESLNASVAAAVLCYEFRRD
jgi:TrmH family RNA methyltransferase